MKTMRAPRSDCQLRREQAQSYLKWFYPIIHPTTPSPTNFDPLPSPIDTGTGHCRELATGDPEVALIRHQPVISLSSLEAHRLAQAIDSGM